MGQISTLFVHKVVNATVALSAGARRRALFEFAGVDPDAPIDPKRLIADTDYYRLCESVMREAADGVSLPLHVGASMRCDDYGAFGLAWKSAVDLRRSYQRAERYWRLLTSVSTYEVREESGRLFMILHREGERRLGLRVSNEQTVVAITQISREVSQRPFSPLAVHFKHRSPGDLAAHERYFGCQVHYGSDRDALEVSEEQLATPNRLGDPGLSSFFDSHLENDMAQFSDDQSLEHRVRTQISQSLSDGTPGVAQIAERLGMSSRTLQRRLADLDCGFHGLVDETRKELAERLLGKTDYALAEVAFLTGFSEQSTFSRAFKRWNGRTPAHYRKDAAAR